jgi:hypothetical protein
MEVEEMNRIPFDIDFAVNITLIRRTVREYADVEALKFVLYDWESRHHQQTRVNGSWTPKADRLTH